VEIFLNCLKIFFLNTSFFFNVIVWGSSFILFFFSSQMLFQFLCTGISVKETQIKMSIHRLSLNPDFLSAEK